MTASAWAALPGHRSSWLSGRADPALCPSRCQGSMGTLPWVLGLGSAQTSSCTILLRPSQPWSHVLPRRCLYAVGICFPDSSFWASVTNNYSLWLHTPSPRPWEPLITMPPHLVPVTLSQSTTLSFGSIAGSVFCVSMSAETAAPFSMEPWREEGRGD